MLTLDAFKDGIVMRGTTRVKRRMDVLSKSPMLNVGFTLLHLLGHVREYFGRYLNKN